VLEVSRQVLVQAAERLGCIRPGGDRLGELREKRLALFVQPIDRRHADRVACGCALHLR
jgi:hypothetical protein